MIRGLLRELADAVWMDRDRLFQAQVWVSFRSRSVHRAFPLGDQPRASVHGSGGQIQSKRWVDRFDWIWPPLPWTEALGWSPSGNARCTDRERNDTQT